jgi:hypothetical protein
MFDGLNLARIVCDLWVIESDFERCSGCGYVRLLREHQLRRIMAFTKCLMLSPQGEPVHPKTHIALKRPMFRKRPVKTQGDLCLANKMNMALIPPVIRGSIHLYSDSVACNFKKLSEDADFSGDIYQ